MEQSTARSNKHLRKFTGRHRVFLRKTTKGRRRKSKTKRRAARKTNRKEDK